MEAAINKDPIKALTHFLLCHHYRSNQLCKDLSRCMMSGPNTAP